jgi:hypothetical protein
LTVDSNEQGQPTKVLMAVGVALLLMSLVALLVTASAAVVTALAAFGLGAFVIAVLAPHMAGAQSIGITGITLTVEARRQVAQDVASAESELKSKMTAPARNHAPGAGTPSRGSAEPRLIFAAQAVESLKRFPPNEHKKAMEILNRLASGEVPVEAMWNSSDPPAVYLMVSPNAKLSISYREVPSRVRGGPSEILVAGIYRQGFSKIGRGSHVSQSAAEGKSGGPGT